MKPLVVVAIGGNALLRPGQVANATNQRANLARSAGPLVRLAEGRRMVLTHGNGPQVGVLAVQAAADPDLDPHPLDVIDAESVGLIGYLIAQALSAHLDPGSVAAVLTRVAVAKDDPAFGRPTKPVGPWYPAPRADQMAAEYGWTFVAGDRGHRRVVPSPEPRGIVEIRAIESLVTSDQIVIAGGGGGIPVTDDGSGGLTGVEAVVDKDLTSALLAVELGAEQLIVLTDIDAVYLDHGTPTARPLAATTPSELRRHEFEPGSMGPKVEAVCRFVDATGGEAVIGALDEVDSVLDGTSGTRVNPD